MRRRSLREALSRRAPPGRERLAQRLVEAGIECAFTVPGDIMYETLAAACREGIAIRACRTQNSALFASAAYNYAKGAVRSAAMITRGPGVTNGVSAIASLHANALPALVIASGEDRASAAAGAFQGFDPIPLVTPVTKAVFRTETPDEVDAVFVEAWKAVTRGRPGPVFLEMKRSSLESACSAPLQSLDFRKTAPPTTRAADLDRIAERLRQASRPLAILGRGLRWGVAPARLRAFLEDAALPFVASPMAAGVAAAAHPLNRQKDLDGALSQADFVLLLGARLNWTFRSGERLPAEAFVAQIDIATEIGAQGRNPDIAVTADLAEALPALHERVALREQGDRSHSATRTEFARPIDAGQPISWERRVARAVDAAAGPDCFFVFDASVSMRVALEEVAPRGPWSRFTPGTDGHIGSGLGYAIGVQSALPDRQAVLLSGDYSFGLHLADLETLTRYGIAAKIVVFDNRGLAGPNMGEPELAGLDPRTLRCSTPQRFDLVMDALGGKGLFASDDASVDKGLAQLLACDGPALLHVRKV